MSGQHLSLDELADALAGEPSGHLDGCATCRAELAALDVAFGAVRADLDALPEPELPDDVTARLDAALAGLAGTAVRTATVTPLESRRTRRTGWVAGASGVAAAAALVVGAVAFWPDTTRSNDSATTSAEGRSSVSTSATGRDYKRDGALVKSALPGLLTGTGAAELGSMAQDSAGGTGGAAPQAPTTAGSKALSDPSSLTRLQDPAVLADCLTGLSDPGDEGIPLAVDFAAFEGKPALLVVLPAKNPKKLDVFFVGAGCTSADPQLLHFLRVDRPS